MIAELEIHQTKSAHDDRQDRWREYEKRKAELPGNLSDAEYQAEIKRILSDLNL
jgi:hypothetical protein